MGRQKKFPAFKLKPGTLYYTEYRKPLWFTETHNLLFEGGYLNKGDVFLCLLYEKKSKSSFQMAMILVNGCKYYIWTDVNETNIKEINCNE